MKRMIVVTLPLLAALSWVAYAGVYTGGDFGITRSTIDGGGGRSSGGDFVLVGTAGQPEAQPLVANGKGFREAGGFWANAGELLDLIFKDGFESP